MTKTTSFSLGSYIVEEQESKLAALRAALIEGENSGTPTPFDFDTFIASKSSPPASPPRAS